MKTTSFIFALGLALFITVVGCSHFGAPVKDIGIDDIAGSWENIQFGYFYLYIDKTGTGYFIPGLDQNDDIYKINSIVFNGYSAIITFVEIGNDKGQIKVECTPFGKDLFALRTMDENEKDAVYFFMRESKVQELRHKAKEFIKKEGFGT